MLNKNNWIAIKQPEFWAKTLLLILSKNEYIMASIYDTSDNTQLINRIQKLNASSTPLWGKMSVDQICEHYIAAINVAFGKQDLTISFPIRLLGRLLKNKAFNSDFGKNSPTAKEFRITSHSDFEKAKHNL